ncbi:MAG: hypothetical protein AAB116_11040 [Candidatus Poribacteria bacterium]
MINLIKSIVDYAYDNVPLYRKLYSKKPNIDSIKDFKNLPYIGISDFCANMTIDSISEVDDIIAILPAIDNKAIFPFPRLESADDRDIRYRVFYYLLEQMDIDEGSTFTVITDSKHAYFCGELVNNLLFYQYPTTMLFLRDHTPDEMRQWVNKLKPDCLLLGTDRMIDNVAEWGVPNLLTINRYDKNLSNKGVRHYDIYAISEISWIAIRIDSSYIYPEEFFYIESDPKDDILVLTTLENYLQPFIRYKTPDKVKMLDGNRFQITYIGEH